MLKETIDRMRFDMDEMRNSAASAAGGSGGTGTGSATSTLNKTLGAELLGKLNDEEWDDLKNVNIRHQLEDEELDEGRSETTAVNSDGEETEGEDVVQTIITRKKRVRSVRAIVFTTLPKLTTGDYCRRCQGARI